MRSLDTPGRRLPCQWPGLPTAPMRTQPAWRCPAPAHTYMHTHQSTCSVVPGCPRAWHSSWTPQSSSVLLLICSSKRRLFWVSIVLKWRQQAAVKLQDFTLREISTGAVASGPHLGHPWTQAPFPKTSPHLPSFRQLDLSAPHPTLQGHREPSCSPTGAAALPPGALGGHQLHPPQGLQLAAGLPQALTQQPGALVLQRVAHQAELPQALLGLEDAAEVSAALRGDGTLPEPGGTGPITARPRSDTGPNPWTLPSWPSRWEREPARWAGERVRAEPR